MPNHLGHINHTSSSPGMISNPKVQDIKIPLDTILETLKNILSLDDIAAIDPILAQKIKRLLPEFRSGSLWESILFKFSPHISWEDQKTMIFRVIGITIYKSLLENIKSVNEYMQTTKNLPDIISVEIIFSLYSGLEKLKQSDLADKVEIQLTFFLESIFTRYVKTYQNLFLLDMQKHFRESLSYYDSVDAYENILINHLSDRYIALKGQVDSVIALRDVKAKFIDFYTTKWEITNIYFALNKANLYLQNTNIIKLLSAKYLPNSHP